MTAIPRPDPRLRGDGIVLRPFTEHDVARVAATCAHPSTRRFLADLPDPYGEDQARTWIATHEPGRREGSTLVQAIADAADDRLLGALTAEFDSPTTRAELGYWLHPDERGAGHMTTAVALLVPWLSAELGIDRIELLTDPDNAPSQAVARRCGFALEGRVRDHVRANGAHSDSLVWALGDAGSAASRPKQTKSSRPIGPGSES